MIIKCLKCPCIEITKLRLMARLQRSLDPLSAWITGRKERENGRVSDGKRSLLSRFTHNFIHLLKRQHNYTFFLVDTYDYNMTHHPTVQHMMPTMLNGWMMCHC